MSLGQTHSFTRFLNLSYAVLCASSLAVAHADISPRTDLVIRNVTDLPVLEVSDGHLFHADALWVARTRTTDNESHRVEVYSSDGKSKIASVSLTHSIVKIYPWRDQSVIVHGFAQNPVVTRYTKLQLVNGKVTATPTTVPDQFFFEEFAGDGNRMFFGERGSAAVYALRNGSFKPVVEQFSGPGAMALMGNNLFILELRDNVPGDEDIQQLDLTTGKHKRTFTDAFRNGLVSLIGLPSLGLVATAEINADQVLLIDAQKNILTHTLAIAGGSPRALLNYGRCLLVGSQESRIVTVYDLGGTQPEVIDAWDLSTVGSKFKKIRALSVNPETGTVFARSSYSCTGCAETMSSVIAVEDIAGKLKNSCTSAAHAKPSFVAESDNDPVVVNSKLLEASSEDGSDVHNHEH